MANDRVFNRASTFGVLYRSCSVNTPPPHLKLMVSSVSEEREVVGSSELTMTCISCFETNLTDVFRLKTVVRWLGIAPIWITHETVAKCPHCDATVRSSADLDELLHLSPEQLGNRFCVRIGLVEKFLVVAAWALIFTGPVSSALFLAAYFMVPKASIAWRKSIVIGLIASVAFLPVVFIIAMIADLAIWFTS